MPNTKRALRYVGEDPEAQWIPGVPARDMSADEVAARVADTGVPFDPDALVACGLYEYSDGKSVAPEVTADDADKAGN